jgi:hypothetical protein
MTLAERNDKRKYDRNKRLPIEMMTLTEMARENTDEC